MPQKAIQNNERLAHQIKERRMELGLTIEEAAQKAGVGTKTWCRYESGESIREDKCKGICKALSWFAFPNQHDEERKVSLEDYRNHELWSSFLEENYGSFVAMAFAVGSELLNDHISDDLHKLSSMPRGSHVGLLSFSMLSDDLPEQFLPLYDYDFLYRMKCTLAELCNRARTGDAIIAHSVLQELILYLCCEEATAFVELCGDEALQEEREGSTDWAFDLFDDMDIVTFLYSGHYLKSDHPYHFSRWDEMQFYMDNS